VHVDHRYYINYSFKNLIKKQLNILQSIRKIVTYQGMEKHISTNFMIQED